MTTHKPPPRPTAAELAALPLDDLERALLELVARQPGCPISGDGGCFSCRDNEIRAARAGELLRRYRALEVERDAWIKRAEYAEEEREKCLERANDEAERRRALEAAARPVALTGLGVELGEGGAIGVARDYCCELLRRYRALEAAARPVLALADVAANSDARSTSREREALRALLPAEEP